MELNKSLKHFQTMELYKTMELQKSSEHYQTMERHKYSEHCQIMELQYINPYIALRNHGATLIPCSHVTTPTPLGTINRMLEDWRNICSTIPYTNGKTFSPVYRKILWHCPFNFPIPEGLVDYLRYLSLTRKGKLPDMRCDRPTPPLTIRSVQLIHRGNMLEESQAHSFFAVSRITSNSRNASNSRDTKNMAAS